ncbi:MAG: molybdopterin-dependent oxidoreductase [Actinomycetota bacterium]|nr:molybdopterin-dependent oxidoreductase [Actinomycetota bacterium]
MSGPTAAGDRRWFLRGALGASAATALLTVGSTVPGLERFSVLRSRTPSTSPNGIPVNRTPAAAQVTLMAEDVWRVTVVGPTGSRDLGLAELTAMSQTTVVLPIACVEGWSASTSWTGVRVRDLMALVGGSSSDVTVESAEKSGGYRVTTLPASYVEHPDSLLALRIGGQRLPLEHGHPARIIAPNRPGVLQTKWVQRLEVTA